MPVPSGPARVALGRGPSERFGWGLPWGAPGCSGPSLGGLGAASGEGASGLFGKSFPTPEASMETDELRGLLTASWGLWRSKGQLELRPGSQRRSSTWDKGSDRAYGGPWALPWSRTCVGLQGETWTGRSQRGREGPFIRSPGAYRGVVQGGGKEVAPQSVPQSCLSQELPALASLRAGWLLTTHHRRGASGRSRSPTLLQATKASLFGFLMLRSPPLPVSPLLPLSVQPPPLPVSRRWPGR